ncbi:double-stranded RNA-binding protein 8-like [Triticum urartu]|nr:double-stranded RNA-binding protein 8-like [Triticum urartu]
MAAAAPAPNASGIRPVKCDAFKSWLQEYAQKLGVAAPEYHTLKEGPCHEPIFKSAVLIDGAKFDSLPGFFTRKAAEQSAAEVALMEIVESIPTIGRIPAALETGLCKNLLQEYAQKMNYIPSYSLTRQASGIAPFTCTVEIGGIQYIGPAARSKKEAEIKGARTALLATQGQLEGRGSGATKHIVVPGKRQVKETAKKPIEIPKPLEVKKGGFKKKWNKRKFMKRNRQAVDVEKNEGKMAGDVINPVSGCIQQSTQEPSSDTVMLKDDEEPSKEARRVVQEPGSDAVMLQPSKEARRAEQESGIAVLKPDELDRRVEHVQGSDIVMLPPDHETRRVKHVPGSDTAMLQRTNKARSVEQEPPRDSGMARSNKEAGCINQELLGETATPHNVRKARTMKHDSQHQCSLM